MSFLSKDYKEPVTSNYVKLAKGDNKLRIVSDPIMGWEYWTEEKGKRKPNRVRTREEVPSDAWNDEDNRPKFFWAMGAWSYEANKAQLWEVTQATIRKTLTSLFNDENWGDPKNYDLVIERDGDGFDTVYTIKPVPPAKFAHDKKLVTINLEALFTGDDPFGTKKDLKADIEIDVDADIDIDEILGDVALDLEKSGEKSGK